MVGKQTGRIMIIAALVSVSCMAADTKYTRARYNVIVERSPFGEDPMGTAQAIQAAQSAKDAAAAAAASKAAEKELRLCFLLQSQTGEIRAGFENKTAKPGDPRSVMLMVGESFRGMKLLDVDLDESSATLDRNGTRVTFELAKAAGGKAAPKRVAAAQPQRRFGGGFRRQPTPPVKPQEPQLSPEEQAKKREEVRENLRQYQMEVIRAGMPPLPIPLTKDMDDQLVSEGILPPE